MALRRSRRGSWASASRVASTWPAAVFDPALPVRSTMASGSPFPPAPWSAKAVTGWKPWVFFQRERPAPSLDARCSGPRGPARLQRPGAVRREGADQPGHQRVGRDRPGEPRLLPQHRDVSQAVPAQRGRREVRDGLPRVVDRPRRPPPGKVARQAPGQAGHPHRLPQQDRPALGDQAATIGGHRHAGGTCAIVHAKGAFGSLMDMTLDKPYSSRSKALFIPAISPRLTQAKTRG